MPNDTFTKEQTTNQETTNFEGCTAPIMECGREQVVNRDIHHQVRHIVPVNTRICNHHIIHHVYEPMYTCCCQEDCTHVYDACPKF